MDISDFTQSFFEEAQELLDDMERLLLGLDVDEPELEALNAIFRAAHSIKGGAGAFGFTVLQKTTHILENLLDNVRQGELALRRDIVDMFLQAKDVLQNQIDAHRAGALPDEDESEQLCAQLRQLSVDDAPPPPPRALEPAPAAGAETTLCVALLGVSEKDRQLLVEELGLLGEVRGSSGDEACFEVLLHTSASADDIEAVLCFVVDAAQVRISTPAAAVAPTSREVRKASPAAEGRPAQSPKGGTETGSIRVPVDKVDHIINLVGELIITQSMLDQRAADIGMAGRDLGEGLALLQRNARDLQEAVMSIRMVQMDYVFSRFPRLVRDLAAKLDKQVELVAEGKSTELDKGLIERIIDPLTHLVRNSLDHGIEVPALREAAGKPATGTLRLSARHQGGNIVIEVGDDGGGLRRDKLLAKARANGLAVSEQMSDDEVWQLIFAPGFSTAEEVSDVSGRGVGMDVVKRNIQAMGGHVEIMSRHGEGTTTRILLPLTLAILDGMSVRVGSEIFILPLGVVSELIQPGGEQLFTMAGDDRLLKVRDEYLPVVSLHEVMDVERAASDLDDCIAVIVEGDKRRYALLVDEPLNQQQVVVKNLETNYRKVPGVSGATILGDGRVALILDVAELHRFNHAKKKFHAAVEQRPRFQWEVATS
ncbi:MAG: chemotaxis protein CheA [Pseudomonas sp.]